MNEMISSSTLLPLAKGTVLAVRLRSLEKIGSVLYFKLPLFLSTSLSGESPFQGNSDEETLAHVTAAQWEFDEESFEEITDQSKDFISGLLKKDMRSVYRLSLELHAVSWP